MRGTVGVSGNDRASFLQGLLTNDIEALSSGRGCYATYLTPQGRLITDMNVLDTGNSILLDVDIGITHHLVERFNKLIFSEDVQCRFTPVNFLSVTTCKQCSYRT